MASSMGTGGHIPRLPPRRESWSAPVYFAVYLTYLFLAPESELLHWLSLVIIPLLIVVVVKEPGTRAPRGPLARVAQPASAASPNASPKPQSLFL